MQKWQRRLNWLERRLADGCRLDRNIRELIGAQPFDRFKDLIDEELEKAKKSGVAAAQYYHVTVEEKGAQHD